MASGIGQQKSGFRQAVSNILGFRGRQNILAWTVAGTLAYYFYVKPEQDRAEEQRLAREIVAQIAEEKAMLEAAAKKENGEQ